jgi:hypothetical protein
MPDLLEAVHPDQPKPPPALLWNRLPPRELATPTLRHAEPTRQRATTLDRYSEPAQAGNFGEQPWGISASAINASILGTT